MLFQQEYTQKLRGSTSELAKGILPIIECQPLDKVGEVIQKGGLIWVWKEGPGIDQWVVSGCIAHHLFVSVIINHY